MYPAFSTSLIALNITFTTVSSATRLRLSYCRFGSLVLNVEETVRWNQTSALKILYSGVTHSFAHKDFLATVVFYSQWQQRNSSNCSLRLKNACHPLKNSNALLPWRKMQLPDLSVFRAKCPPSAQDIRIFVLQQDATTTDASNLFPHFRRWKEKQGNAVHSELVYFPSQPSFNLVVQPLAVALEATQGKALGYLSHVANFNYLRVSFFTAKYTQLTEGAELSNRKCNVNKPL